MCGIHFEGEAQSYSDQPKLWLYCANADTSDFLEKMEKDAKSWHWFEACGDTEWEEGEEGLGPDWREEDYVADRETGDS